MELTSEDNEILQSYIKTISNLAKLFGTGCEFVIHSLSSLEESVMAIENGHVSGRNIGSPITDLALEIVEKSKNQENMEPYYSISYKGERLRSITTPIYNKDKLIGLICVNINLDMKVSEFASIFEYNDKITATTSSEYLGNSVEDMIKNLLEKVEQEVLLDSNIPNQDKNKVIIYKLDEKGFFKLRGSIETLAEHLKISPHTIYANLRKKN